MKRHKMRPVTREVMPFDDGTMTGAMVRYETPFVTRNDMVSDASLPPVDQLVIATGWVGGNVTARGLAENLVRAAAARGRRLAVMTYADPLVGTSAYGQSYRDERLVRVVHQGIHDAPAAILGHSRGTITAANTAPALLGEGYLHGFIGLTPKGLDPRPAFDADSADGLAQEIGGSFAHMRNVRGAVSAAAVPLRSALHFAANFPAAWRDMRGLYCDDVTRQVADISHHTPTLMMTGNADVITPPGTIEPRLLAAGYVGAFAVLSTTHVGALIDPRPVQAMYDAMHATLSGA